MNKPVMMEGSSQTTTDELRRTRAQIATLLYERRITVTAEFALLLDLLLELTDGVLSNNNDIRDPSGFKKDVKIINDAIKNILKT